MTVIKQDGADAMKIAGLLDEIMLELVTLVRSATANTARIWNGKHPDIVSRLPVEVRTACFRWLCPGDVLRASHVCRSWRDTTLSEARLWSVFQSHNPYFNYHLLELYVERSGSVNLSICVGSPRAIEVPHRTAALILANASRLRSLIYRDASPIHVATALLAKHLPLLEELVMPLHHLRLPTTWLGGTPPVLRRIEAAGLDIPDTFTPLPTVTSLACRMDAHNGWRPTDGRRLFDVFPCLETLKLSGVASSSLQRLPPSLRSLTVSCIDPASSFSHLLAPTGWIGSHGFGLDSLTLDKPVFILPAFEYFIRRHNKPWNMAIRGDAAVRISLQCPGVCTVTVLLQHDSYLSSQLSIAKPAMENLASLTVTYDVLCCASDTLIIHRATHLEIVLITDSEACRLYSHMSSSGDPVSLHMPRLETLVFTCALLARVDWVTRASSRTQLCKFVTFDSARLKHITLSVPDPHMLDGRESMMNGFKTYADGVTVENSTQRLDDFRASAVW
ncbi:hypothetical protein EXIGLDRAFT_836157 [Exidia glandulosa HHB12029]|uniref:F-box domain-containing protein n=1 Tax=Exidia glandulosa HHB12029 TaxID=1314781 RepID=A0A165I2D9_EXIGL|nr:hypothetical protein EXIGLDRAFT_836157 [Exidia glandulosa HHB12029]